MEAKLRAYVESLFEQAPNTRKAYELKEEMIQNLVEKYHGLCDEGKSEEVAYNIAVSSIGDTSELIAGLSGVQAALTPEEEQRRRRYAILTALAIGLYIIAVIPIIALSPMGYAILGLALMLAFVAAATGILVYVSMTKPRYRRAEDTIVEEFKEWKSSKDSRNEVWKSISAALWMLIVIAYLLTSFLTGAWHITWIIFLIGTALEQIAKAVFQLLKK
ncbi:MAG: permease prefix domain 1-containing protein [Candidatus Pelethousia sp.]|nr:permease prefix domain 1-containing protein [Candidatus Pelethousia sp.]